ncbi:MAG TPA: GAF domain-containing protein [Polyangiales bacterium]|nr:GAF domain-containing protein [Polyangiales bacterium]
MGLRSQKYFDEAGKVGGLVAKMRLASLAQVTSTQASTQTDTPELLAKLDTALKRIREEFGQAEANDNSASAATQAAALPSVAPATGNPELPRRCMTVIAELIAQRSLFIGDLAATVRRVNEAAASVLNIERVSVWLLDAEHTQITCADLFERSAARHSAGTVLKAADFGVYFDALAAERTIAAEDANTDPRTRCFSEVYLKPLNIGAMLDVPIWASNKMVGVICHEHVGSTRRWSTDDETLAYILASLVALTLEQRSRNRAGAI